jgi:hypothetical protein
MADATFIAHEDDFALVFSEDACARLSLSEGDLFTLIETGQGGFTLMRSDSGEIADTSNAENAEGIISDSGS